MKKTITEKFFDNLLAEFCRMRRSGLNADILSAMMYGMKRKKTDIPEEIKYDKELIDVAVLRTRFEMVTVMRADSREVECELSWLLAEFKLI